MNTEEITLDTLKEESNLDNALIEAVIDQLGGWDDETGQTLEDIASHGIDGGFSGFIYHSDTVAFAKEHRALIARLAEEQAESFGLGVIEMVQGFGCLKDGAEPFYSQSEIAQCLYSAGDITQVMNALAWYAAEEVAREYQRMIEA